MLVLAQREQKVLRFDMGVSTLVADALRCGYALLKLAGEFVYVHCVVDYKCPKPIFKTYDASQHSIAA